MSDEERYEISPSEPIRLFNGQTKEIKYKITNKTEFSLEIPELEVLGPAFVKIVSFPHTLPPFGSDNILIELSIPEDYFADDPNRKGFVFVLVGPVFEEHLP